MCEINYVGESHGGEIFIENPLLVSELGSNNEDVEITFELPEKGLAT